MPPLFAGSQSPSLNLPVALQKGECYVSTYPIAKCVSYSKLSPPRIEFVVGLSSICIP